MSRTILCVDDNPHDIDLLQIAFEDCGVPVTIQALTDGQQAIDELKRLSTVPRASWPAVMVLDLNMPRTNGHEVLAFMREEGGLCDLPVVVLTTSNAPADRERCLAAGVRDYLVKPRRFADFAPIVERLVRYLTCAEDGAR
ncbi:MAG: response regulator [Planctomycetes bacterium]|nr:response regulator [Planctomycetota bacterium]